MIYYYWIPLVGSDNKDCIFDKKFKIREAQLGPQSYQIKDCILVLSTCRLGEMEYAYFYICFFRCVDVLVIYTCTGVEYSTVIEVKF